MRIKIRPPRAGPAACLRWAHVVLGVPQALTPARGAAPDPGTPPASVALPGSAPDPPRIH